MSKLCFFIGHSGSPYTLRDDLDKAVEFVIQERGVREFVVGQYGNFDRMAASVVKK